MLDSFLLRGTSSPPPDPIELRAGPLHLLFEPSNGMIRRICLGEIEVWRGLYVAVRDQNWGTVTPRVWDLKTEIKKNRFDIRFNVECKQDEIDFRWHGILRVLSKSSQFALCYDFFGEARSDFLRNRIGFCLLHPPSCAGRPCEVVNFNIETGYCDTLQSHFPDTIAPHQPFKNLDGLTHEFAPGQWAQAFFNGDIFETEDQRNWTDASFKTYCTPLDLPFPVEIKRGVRIKQSVILRLLSADVKPPAQTISITEKPAITIRLQEGTSPTHLPAIGLCMASHGEQLTENEIARLRLLNLSHLRADLKFNANWQVKLKQAAQEAKALNAKLELALHLPPEPQQILREVAAMLEQNEVSIARFLVLSEGEKVTSEATARAAREVLGSHGAPLVGGTDFYFTEINRQHPPVNLLDGVCFSITPQVHAFDDLSLMENLEMQAAVVENAHRLFGGLPIHISPVTFKKRSNPDATGAEAQISPGELPTGVDPRQMSLFGAAWTLGSLKYLSEAGVTSITYYETTGMKGVMQQENVAPHSQFPAPPAGVFPTWFVLFSGITLENWLPCESSSPMQIQALLLNALKFKSLMLANLTSQIQRTDLPALPDSDFILIDSSNVWQWMTNDADFMKKEHPRFSGSHLTLNPYATAVLVWQTL